MEVRGYYAVPSVAAQLKNCDPKTFLCNETQKQQYMKNNASLTENDWRKIMVGYLHVPLSYDHTKKSSLINLDLRVSVWIGLKGPDAPLVLQHNGGPRTADAGPVQMQWSFLKSPVGKVQLEKEYNILGIQQRGMSDDSNLVHWPEPIVSKTFEGVCGKRLEPPVVKEKSYNLRDFTTCPCNLPEGDSEAPEPFPDPEDETAVDQWFAFAASRNQNCYKADYWKMSHGNESFNYLDYVGTQTLAMDIDRLRQALGAEKLSFMGLSYGTAVSAVYATAYPEHVGKVVLNGVVTPGPMKEDYYSSQVISSQQAMAKYLQICNDEGEKQHVPDDMLTRCALPTTDPELFFADLVEKIRRNASSPSSMYSRSTRTGKAFTLTPPMLYQYMNADVWLPSASPWTKTLELLNMLGGHNESAVTSATESIFDQVCTNDWKTYGYCFDYMDYVHGAHSDGGLTENAVRGLDYAGVYSAKGGKGVFNALKDRYGASPLFFGNMKAGYGLMSWAPLPTPAQLGSRPGIRMLVVNDLFDRSTPYSSAKQMREVFPSAHLMTWQGTGHMVSYAADSYDPEGVESCVERINDFMLNDVMPPEGFTCHQTRKFTW